MSLGQVRSQDSPQPQSECQEGKSEGSDDILVQIWKLSLREAGGRMCLPGSGVLDGSWFLSSRWKDSCEE